MIAVEWKEATFEVRPPGAMAGLQMAKIVRDASRLEDSDAEGQATVMAGMLDILERTLAPADWGRFVDHTYEVSASMGDIQEFLQLVMAAGAGSRPTGRSSDSSDGPQPTKESSEVVSSSPEDRVIDRFNRRGRPDLALLVANRRDARTG